MEIVVLAWGSLIWQPENRYGRLAVRSGSKWSSDGPVLPVEFARISSDGRLTLVLVTGYATESPVLWRPSAAVNLDAAIDNLARRETGAPRSAIHATTPTGETHGDPHPSTRDRVATWLSEIGANAAIWTGLPPGERWAELGYPGFAVDHAVEYVRSLTGSKRERSLEYVRNAPTQIDTPVRRALGDLLLR